MKKLVFNDRGSVTIEAALSLSVLIIVAAAIVGAIASMAAYISAMVAIAPTIAAATIISTVNESAASMVTEPRSLNTSFFTCFPPYLE